VLVSANIPHTRTTTTPHKGHVDHNFHQPFTTKVVSWVKTDGITGMSLFRTGSMKIKSKRRMALLETNLTLNPPTTTIVAQPFSVIKWQLKFNPVA